MRTRSIATVLGLVGVALVLQSIPVELLTPDRTRAQRASSSSLPVDVVVLIDDFAVAPPSAGCDAVTIHDFRSGRVIDRGIRHVSPGRLAARADLSLIVANPANGNGRTSNGDRLNRDYRAWLAVRHVQSEFQSIRDGFYVGHDAAYKGGIAFGDNGSLLLATATGAYVDERYMIPPGAPFGVARHDVPLPVQSGGRLPPPAARMQTSSLVGEILPIANTGLARLVTLGGQIITVDTQRLIQQGDPVAYPTPISPRNKFSQTQPAIEAFHATATRDGRLVAVTGMLAGNVALVDMQTRQTTLVDIGSSGSFAGGVAFNGGWVNEGLLAVHASDRIAILSFDSTRAWHTIGELPIRRPLDGPNDLVNTAHGPQFSIAWSTDGSHLIFATQDGPAEFGVAEVLDSGRRIEYRRSLTACPDGSNSPNDIWTANGLITPTFTPTSDLPPTATPPPSPTPSPSATATPPPTTAPSSTPAPSATPSPTPSPAAPPRPIYLPVALHLRCDPTQQPIDVALVLDASSSMADLTRSGRPKIDAALDAARAFLDLLALDPDPSALATDQAAVVTFNSGAWLLAPLTADRAVLDDALGAVALGQQTRLDRAVAVGAAALADAARRRSVNRPVLVLLTDGRANPVPVDVAVAEASAAKAAGVTLFAIGLGDDLDVGALGAMASTPAGFLRAPDAEDLAAAYAQVARSIPCVPAWP